MEYDPETNICSFGTIKPDKLIPDPVNGIEIFGAAEVMSYGFTG